MALPLIIAAVAMAAGSVMKGISGYQQGRFQESMANFNKRQLRIDAQIAEENANAKAKALIQSGAQLRSAQNVGYSKAGLRMSGTPLEVLAKSAENIQLDSIGIKRQGKFESGQLRTQAEFQSIMARQYRRSANMALASGLLGGASSATGASSGGSGGMFS